MRATDRARRDVEVMLAAALGVQRAYLYAHGDEPLDRIGRPTRRRDVEPVPRRHAARLHHRSARILESRARRLARRIDSAPGNRIARRARVATVAAARAGAGSGNGFRCRCARDQAGAQRLRRDGDRYLRAGSRSRAAQCSQAQHSTSIFVLATGTRQSTTSTTRSSPILRTFAEMDPHLDALVGEPRLALVAGSMVSTLCGPSSTARRPPRRPKDAARRAWLRPR